MKKSFVLSLCAIACAATAYADPVYDNVSTGATAGPTGGQTVGQSFVTGPIALTLNTLLFAQTTDGTDYAPTAGQTVNLYANNPATNLPLTTVSLATFTLSSYGQNITEADTNGAVLTANTRFWLVLNAPTATSTVIWTYYSPTNYTANSLYGVTLPAANTAFKTLNGVTTTFALAQGPQSIYLDADVLVVPEPSTYAMLALGGAGIFFLVRRARAVRAA